MKKIMVLVIALLLSACQSEKATNLDDRANKIIYLAEADGFKDMSITSSTDNKVIIENKDMCLIEAVFKDNVLQSLETKKLKGENEEYSCVMRTLLRDEDFLGTDETKNMEFQNRFRDETNFIFEGLKIERDFYKMKVSRLES